LKVDVQWMLRESGLSGNRRPGKVLWKRCFSTVSLGGYCSIINPGKVLGEKRKATPMFDFTTFPVLVTKRLTLRELRQSDATDVLRFRGDPIVQKYDDPVIHTVAEAESFLKDLQAEYDAKEGINWAVTLGGQNTVFGIFSLHHWNQYHRHAEAGYGLAQAYWGQGIGSEALRAIVQFGFEKLNLNRIYARTISDNHESVRLLERLGFRREGTQREHSWEDDGTFHDSAIYGILAREFRTG
jgi:[ribosomal protein S5]-alanine N-acetyltransferase